MNKPRIQDDLYTYVNQEKLDELVIPDDQPCVGGFQTLAVDLEQTMINEFKEMCEKDLYPNDFLKRACSLFKVAKNAEKKESDGIAPALNNLAILNEISDLESFSKMYKALMFKGLPLPFKVLVETDMKNTKQHCVAVQGPSVILPDASYYKPEMAAQKEMILGIWTNIAKMIMAKSDLTPEDQEKYILDTLAFDAILGSLVKTNEEWSEYVAMYNPMNIKNIASLVDTINLNTVLTDLFDLIPDTIIVFEPRFFENFKSVLNIDTLELYKHWAYTTGLIGSCALLTEELRDLGSMYFRTIAGIPANTPIEKFADQLASGMYSEPVGLYYGEKYFGEEAKKDITEIVYQIKKHFHRILIYYKYLILYQGNPFSHPLLTILELLFVLLILLKYHYFEF